jgi:hypothetical protein
MPNVDITVDAKAHHGLPPDPTVKLPDSVTRAAAAANAYYEQPPPVEPVATPAEPVQAAPEPVVEPVVEPAPAPKTRAKPRASAPAEPANQPVVAPAAPAAPAAPVSEEQWEHRFRSMKGRYDASQGVLAQMQEQMSMMANELTRTQAMLNQPLNQPPPAPHTFVTEDDRKNYGDDLIDLTKRAAREAVEPEINAVKQENQQLQDRLLKQAQQGVVQVLDQQVPDWREINRSQRFRHWLSLPDIYSGVVRKQMLDAAYAAASAPRVLAFFKGFVNDEVATGNIDPPVALEQPTPAPRVAAASLETIAAPGRARPASGGNTPAPADDKPTFTHVQIKAFYNDVRSGAYRGREADKNATEQAIFAAQREGRIR